MDDDEDVNDRVVLSSVVVPEKKKKEKRVKKEDEREDKKRKKKDRKERRRRRSRSVEVGETSKRLVVAKNNLESYCFNMKQAVEDEKLKDKISDADRQTVLDKCNDAIKWLDSNQLAEKEEFEHKQKEVESVCNPIITKLYQAGGAPSGPAGGVPPRSGAAGGAAGGPTIEEVD